MTAAKKPCQRLVMLWCVPRSPEDGGQRRGALVLGQQCRAPKIPHLQRVSPQLSQLPPLPWWRWSLFAHPQAATSWRHRNDIVQVPLGCGDAGSSGRARRRWEHTRQRGTSLLRAKGPSGPVFAEKQKNASLPATFSFCIHQEMHSWKWEEQNRVVPNSAVAVSRIVTKQV